MTSKKLKKTTAAKGITRRTFLKGAAAGVAVSSGALHAPYVSSAGQAAWGPFGQPPNILIIMNDQNRTEQHFPKGWAEANLPWLTRLQQTGVTFRRGMASSTACSPSRSALFTSTYPTINGVKKVNETLNMDQQLYTGGSLTTLGQMMQDAGYIVRYKGKWHLDEDISDRSEIRPAYQDIMMIEDDAMKAEWFFPGWTSPDIGTAESGAGTSSTKPAQYSALNSLGGGRVNNDIRVVKGPLYAPNQQSAVDFLYNYNPNDGTPFCLVVSMANPHDIWTFPYSNIVAGYTDPLWEGPAFKDFELPQSYQQTDLSTKPSAQEDWLNKFQGGAFTKNGDPDMVTALSYVKFYAYLQTKIDALTGDLLTALQSNKHDGPKMERDTLVVRLSDHGEMAMAQGGLRQKENNCYDETIRIPTIFSNPLLPQDKSRDSLVGLIDVLPTLAEICGIADPSSGGKYTIQGQSYAEQIVEPSGSGWEQFLFATDDVDASKTTSIRAIVEKDWKYAVYYTADYDSDNPNGTASDFEYEMYNSAADPNEINNLLNCPKADDIARAQSLHDSLTMLVGDTSTVPVDWPDQMELKPDPANKCNEDSSGSG